MAFDHAAGVVYRVEGVLVCDLLANASVAEIADLAVHASVIGLVADVAALDLAHTAVAFFVQVKASFAADTGVAVGVSSAILLEVLAYNWFEDRTLQV